MTVTMLPQHLQLTTSISASANPYLIDQLQFMQNQETSYYQCTESYLPTWATVTSHDRRTMASWSYDIVDACSINREIAVIGMSYFDRFMSSSNSSRAKAALVSRREFQLAFITCLIVALKCRAGMQVDSDFVSDTICQKLYNESEIIEMEKEILSGLQWRLNGPSPHEFIGGLLELLPGMANMNVEVVEKLKTAASKSVETAVLDYGTALGATPSSLAYAALLTGMQNLETSTFHPLDRLAWMQNVNMVMGMKADDLSCRVLRDRLFEVTHQGSGCGSNAAPISGNVVVDVAPVAPSASNEHVMCATTTNTPQHQYRNYQSSSQGSSSTATADQYAYCTPISSASSSVQESEYEYNDSNDPQLYLDILSMASTVSSSDLSPVCAMLDGRLEVQ